MSGVKIGSLLTYLKKICDARRRYSSLANICAGRGKYNLRPLLPTELLRNRLVIFWAKDVGKVSFPMFFDAVSPKMFFQLILTPLSGQKVQKTCS